MSTPSRPIFPVVLSVKSAVKYIRELTRWVGPGFHPDEDFHDYVKHDGQRSYSDQEANELNSELEAAASMLEFHGIEPCRIGLTVQRKTLLNVMAIKKRSPLETIEFNCGKQSHEVIG